MALEKASVLALAALAVTISCGKKVESTAPLVGWHSEGTEDAPWAGDCYYPPDYQSMLDTDRKMARQKSLEAMKSQWLGQKNDGLEFDATAVDDLEIILLGRPDRIEEVSVKNLEYCQQYMTGTGSASSWEDWLRGLAASLTEGECNTPLDYQLIQYLDIQTSWQQPIPFCKGNRAEITATQSDRYRISEDSPWINADGDESMPSTSSEYPCNFQGCFAGQLIGRFVTFDGVETIFPIGTYLRYEAPEHGTFTWTINDTTYFDNEWHKEGAITDRTAITVTPID